MSVVNIPDNHHVLRHCKGRLVIRDGEELVGVFPELFHLRSATAEREQEKYLSALYFEYFDCVDSARYEQCCDAMTFSPKARDAMAKLNAGLVREEGQKRKRTLRVTHEGTAKRPAYAAIRGIPPDPDDELSSALAQVALIEAVEVSKIRPKAR